MLIENIILRWEEGTEHSHCSPETRDASKLVFLLPISFTSIKVAVPQLVMLLCTVYNCIVISLDLRFLDAVFIGHHPLDMGFLCLGG